jgi:DNA-binding IclR family transcriptional regulator
MLERVKSVIGNAPGGASKADVLSETGLSESRWNAVVNALIEQGDVTRTGERRATRYHLARKNSLDQADVPGSNAMEGQV